MFHQILSFCFIT